MRLISSLVSTLLLCSGLWAAPAASRPTDRELTDHPLTDQQEKDYRLALMEAQKPKDLEILKKIESEIDRTEAAWKSAQDKSTADRRQLKRNDKHGDGKADDHERRLQTKDAARDRHEDAFKVCGAARKAILSLRRGMSMSAQSAVHFKFGQEKKAVTASTAAALTLVGALREYPSIQIGETSAWGSVWNSGSSFAAEVENSIGLHLVTICNLAETDPWLAANAWLGADQRYRDYLSIRKPDQASKSGKMLYLIRKLLPKLPNEVSPKLADSAEYWSQFAAPPPPNPQEPKF